MTGGRGLLPANEFGHEQQRSEEMYRHFFTELVVLTALILVVTISLVLVRKRSQTTAEQH